ncbi:MAG: hypothetical protein ACXW20_09170 [Burkholderiales bacterium]
MNQPTLDNIRKRILMFYFVGGVNLFMAVYVMSAGAGTVAGGTLTTIAFIFIAFAALNFYVARTLRKRWRHLASQQQAQSQAKTEG